MVNLKRKKNHGFFGIPEPVKHREKEVRLETTIEVEKITKTILYHSCWSTFVNKQRYT